jgi:hypothetical protein
MRRRRKYVLDTDPISAAVEDQHVVRHCHACQACPSFHPSSAHEGAQQKIISIHSSDDRGASDKIGANHKLLMGMNNY